MNAAPVVLTVQSKSLQTEDTETVQVSYLHHLRVHYMHFFLEFNNVDMFCVVERNGYFPKRPQSYPESHERDAERQVVSPYAGSHASLS